MKKNAKVALFTRAAQKDIGITVTTARAGVTTFVGRTVTAVVEAADGKRYRLEGKATRRLSPNTGIAKTVYFTKLNGLKKLPKVGKPVSLKIVSLKVS